MATLSDIAERSLKKNPYRGLQGPDGGPSPIALQGRTKLNQGPEGGPSPFPVQRWQGENPTPVAPKPTALVRAEANQPPQLPPQPAPGTQPTPQDRQNYLAQFRNQAQQYMPQLFEPTPYIQQMQSPWDLLSLLMGMGYHNAEPAVNGYPGQEWLQSIGKA